MHRESIEKNDPVWDCTLIRTLKDKGDAIVNAIYHWQDADVWEYARQNNIKLNPLYEKGYYRVGCIGCPLASYKEKTKEFSDYPTYKRAYINAFDKMLKAREAKGMINKCLWGETGEDVFNWWMGEYKRNVKGQITMDEYLGN